MSFRVAVGDLDYLHAASVLRRLFRDANGTQDMIEAPRLIELKGSLRDLSVLPCPRGQTGGVGESTLGSVADGLEELAGVFTRGVHSLPEVLALALASVEVVVGSERIGQIQRALISCSRDGEVGVARRSSDEGIRKRRK